MHTLGTKHRGAATRKRRCNTLTVTHTPNIAVSVHTAL